MQSSGWQPRTPQEGLIAALIRVGRTMKNAGGREADPHTYWLLHVLHCHGTMRMTDLAVALDLDTSTVSRQLGQLDKAGLVVRSQHPDDGRAQVVTVSTAGEELLDRAQAERVRFVAERTATWSGEDVETLTRLLLDFAGSPDDPAVAPRASAHRNTPDVPPPAREHLDLSPAAADPARRTHELEHA